MGGGDHPLRARFNSRAGAPHHSGRGYVHILVYRAQLTSQFRASALNATSRPTFGFVSLAAWPTAVASSTEALVATATPSSISRTPVIPLESSLAPSLLRALRVGYNAETELIQDIYCYSCDDAKIDPDLANHLRTFGINVLDQSKTEKSMTELVSLRFSAGN